MSGLNCPLKKPQCLYCLFKPSGQSLVAGRDGGVKRRRKRRSLSWLRTGCQEAHKEHAHMKQTRPCCWGGSHQRHTLHWDRNPMAVSPHTSRQENGV